MRMARPVRVLVIVLLTISVWNAGYELNVPGSTRSFRTHDTDDLLELMREEQLSLSKRFDIYVLLADVAPHRTLVAPAGYLTADRLDGLSDMTLEVGPTGGATLTADQTNALLSLPGPDGSFDLGEDQTDRLLHIVTPAASEQQLRLVLTDTAAIVVGESTFQALISDG